MTNARPSQGWQSGEFEDWEPYVPKQRKSTAGRLLGELKSAFRPKERHEEMQQAMHQWQVPVLEVHEATINLDDLTPPTLFYLSKLVDEIPQLEEVYVEHLQSGRTKHWAVLTERDYDAMDNIYSIEEETMNRFPRADISFRVSVSSNGGPSISESAKKILDVE